MSVEENAEKSFDNNWSVSDRFMVHRLSLFIIIAKSSLRDKDSGWVL